MPKRLKKRPAKDVNEIAFDLVRRSTGTDDEPTPAPVPSDELRAYMKELGRRGGEASGRKRMENLTDEQRSAIALKAARARWEKRAKKR